MTVSIRPVGLGLIIILLSFATAPAAVAQGTTPDKKEGTVSCADMTGTIDINIQNPKGNVVYNSGVSRNDLVRIQQSRSRGVQQGYLKPLGLTLSDFTFQIGTSARLLPQPDNTYCAYPRSFDITIGYSEFKVYIDRRYGKGSCEYQAILEHENTHVSLYRSNMARNLPDLQRAVYSAARSITPVIVNSPQQGAQYMQGQMAKKLRPLVARMSRGAEIANAKIDTPVSYNQVQGRCRNW